MTHFLKFHLSLLLIIVFHTSPGFSSGPSKTPEAFFNDSYLRISNLVSLTKLTGLGFRTCSGGQLFSQADNTKESDKIEVQVNAEGVIFYAEKLGQKFMEKISGNFLDNKWHLVYLSNDEGNVTLSVDQEHLVIANSTYNQALATPRQYSESSTILWIGNKFIGCLREGPTLVFDKVVTNVNVVFGKCPLSDSCSTQSDHLKDPCRNEPCMQHGTCHNTPTPQGYTCFCQPPYGGKNCELGGGGGNKTTTTPCDKQPSICRNGATCIWEAASSDYTCACTPHFTGRHCDTEMAAPRRACDDATAQQCLNGATCDIVDNNNRVRCTCPQGYEGDRCEINVDDCKLNACKNGARCLDGSNNYTCDCTGTGYRGRFCEIDVDECLSEPCGNRGRCFDMHGAYLCQCEAGYGGRNCNRMERSICNEETCPLAVADCSSDNTECVCKQGFVGTYPNCTPATSCSDNPCRNGGTCSPDKDGGYTCTCPPRISGPACDQRVVESVTTCTPGTCRNGGACTLLETSEGQEYRCTCKEGWTGRNCDEQIHCGHGPCGEHANGCQDYLGGGYYCTCEPGWTGVDCEQQELLGMCTSNPCLNGATCVDQVDFYSCQCAAGYAGKHCHLRLDGCLMMLCQNGGTCVDHVPGSTPPSHITSSKHHPHSYCNCTGEWMGAFCEKPYDICAATKPCRNNATCISSSSSSSSQQLHQNDFKHHTISSSSSSSPYNHYTCDCLPGYEGDRCEINTDDCENVVCPTGRQCVDLVNDHDCRCPEGYTGENCSVDLDPCRSDPCHPKATCKVDKKTLKHACVCPVGYRGANCDIEIDECDPDDKRQCMHGICRAKKGGAGGIQCYCEPGYTGEHCDVDVDECLSVPCHNGAVCRNLINNYECDCPPGYDGKQCKNNIDECDPNPCVDGSQCIDGIAKFTCVCQPGLTGKTCEINIDDCESSPCQNHAPCIDGLNSFTCNCTDTGYSGEFCETNIDDCVGMPCQHGGKCIDKVKDYFCDCYKGFRGTNCEEDINECDPNPCKYGGTCLEKSNDTLYQPTSMAELNVTLPDAFQKPFDYSTAAGYECLCVPGTQGDNCTININECESSPCIQGTCVDQIGGYTCSCDDGFEGVYCETDIDECEKYNPCRNGHCFDRVASYFCDCEPQYGGKNCSVELTGCVGSPCQNNGSCKPYLVDENEHKFNCTCPNGYHGDTCEKITTMSLSGNSLVMVNSSRDEGYDISFRFKTTLGDGVLALGKGVTFYILSISKGKLNLHSSLLNKWDGVFVGSNLNDSNWQRVFVAINYTHLVLAANEEQTIYPITNNNDNSNVSSTSFPLTYIGGSPNNLRKLVQYQPYLVGCIQDVQVNGQWVLPDNVNEPWLTFQNVDKNCSRKAQCDPNPCHSGGHCTDMWKDFSCTCERPYLGHTCQYNYTAATFGYENISDSLVTVTVSDTARRAVRTIVDISMFIRTRQARGQIFYLGSAPGSPKTEETYIAAELEGGELLVRIQFNGTPEAYTVGGVKLNNGHNHLIQVIRNVTLVQVKLNGTEFFRKTISASGSLDAQFLFLGGQPQLRAVRQVNENNAAKEGPTAAASVAPPSNIHFKGIIQDVQISNGSATMVAEFFPLETNDTQIPMSFGTVTFDNATVLQGVLSDDSCKSSVCQHEGECENTWNDYRCICPRGFKGKDCGEWEFCEIDHCPDGFECRNMENGRECLANATFDGKTPPIQYSLVQPNSSKVLSFDKIELTYRTRSWGTVLFALHKNDYFVIFIYHNEVVVEWRMKGVTTTKRFRREHFEGQWLTLYIEYRDQLLIGGFKDVIMDDSKNFEVIDFDFESFSVMLKYGTIYIAGSDGESFDYVSAIKSADYNMTGYLPVSETTTIMPGGNNGLELFDITQDALLRKVDVNKTTDRFKGCLSEIRIGGLLLPYYTKNVTSLHVGNIENYELAQGFEPRIGCLLCIDVDCSNKGRCIDPLQTYKCNCSEGFTADDCSIDIDECESNKCQNNATCLDLIAKYECQCLPGFEGVYCETDIDECESNPCRNQGTCIDLIGTFKCSCPDDFVGRQCEAPLLITCENKPCSAGSTCVPGYNELTRNNFTCTCMEAWEGPLCDTPFCENTLCVNGHCNATTLQRPYCECRRGFEGRLCEININDCVPTSGKDSPCQHGVCNDGINRYDCDCTGTGYSGLLCEYDIDECNVTRGLCGLQGRCLNTPGSYVCECMTPGKCGHMCALDDPCGDNPCVNGECLTRCTDRPDYTCNCTENYAGKNCTDYKVAASQSDGGINIFYIIVPIVLILLTAFAIGMTMLVNVARSKRATRGTYSPSAQEFCNPRLELDHVLKIPPEERLI